MHISALMDMGTHGTGALQAKYSLIQPMNFGVAPVSWPAASESLQAASCRLGGPSMKNRFRIVKFPTTVHIPPPGKFNIAGFFYWCKVADVISANKQ
jgi:hypothetical protein